MRTALVCMAALGAAGCVSAPRSHYAWGSYEDSIYTSYSSPGKLPVEQQIEQFEQDFQKARTTNQPVPPGWHAHLGNLYYQIGKLDQAQQEFRTEKAEFPESAVFMDRLLTALNKQ